MIRSFLFFFLIYFFYLSLSFSNVSYSNSVDKDLTVDRMAILPPSDNVQGIYAQFLEKRLKQLVRESHHWDLVEEKIVGPLFTPEELENNEARVKDIVKSLKADAFIAAGITKNPISMTLTLNLFLKKDARLFLQVREKKFKHFSLMRVGKKIDQMFRDLMDQMPYKGKILSRQGQSVTLGLGLVDGVKVNQELPVIQVIKIKRHPKFHFLVHAEKYAIGKIKVLKVDKTLSFGLISMEVEKNVIQRNSKISYIQSFNY